jgi:hypothetical protein
MSETLDSSLPVADVKATNSDKKQAADAINKAKEANDVQTVLYLNPIPASGLDDETKGILDQFEVMKADWATKIERTVQQQIARGGKIKKDHTLQAGFDRASYRAKLVGSLPKQAPWWETQHKRVSDRPLTSALHRLALQREESLNPSTKELKGDYHHDKAVYQRAVKEVLDKHIHEVPDGRRKQIEKYIAEVLALSLDGLDDVQRFAVTYISLNKTAGGHRPSNSGPIVILGIDY